MSEPEHEEPEGLGEEGVSEVVTLTRALISKLRKASYAELASDEVSGVIRDMSTSLVQIGTHSMGVSPEAFAQEHFQGTGVLDAFKSAFPGTDFSSMEGLGDPALSSTRFGLHAQIPHMVLGGEPSAPNPHMAPPDHVGSPLLWGAPQLAFGGEPQAQQQDQDVSTFKRAARGALKLLLAKLEDAPAAAAPGLDEVAFGGLAGSPIMDPDEMIRAESDARLGRPVGDGVTVDTGPLY